MPYLVSYDIEDDRLRLSVANRLLAIGCLRLQRSVFAGPAEPEDCRNFTEWVDQCPLAQEDSVFVLDVGPETLRAAEWYVKTAEGWSLASDEPLVLFV